MIPQGPQAKMILKRSRASGGVEASDSPTSSNLSSPNSIPKMSAASDRDASTRLFRYIKRARICSCLSFATFRLPRKEVYALFPEVEALDLFLLDPGVTRAWLDDMSAHNTVVSRGVRMGLFPFASNRAIGQQYAFESVDAFMLCMRADELARILGLLCRFGERVSSKALRSPTALLWILQDSVLIARDKWLLLCRRVVSLAALLGLDETESRDRVPLRPCPDSERLSEAAGRALAVFGPFVERSPRVISIPRMVIQMRAAHQIPSQTSNCVQTHHADDVRASKKRRL